LFFSVGFIYDRYGTRTIKELSGLVNVMPILAGFFMIMSLGNISFPGTANFVGEALILLAVGDLNFYVFLIGTGVIVLGSVYTFWLYNRIFFGELKLKPSKVGDISGKEIVIMFVLVTLLI